MLDGRRFLFTERTDNFGRSSILPYLPLTLTNGNLSLEVMALLDTGAAGSELLVRWFFDRSIWHSSHFGPKTRNGNR